MIFDAVVIGLGIARGAETPDSVTEINDPSDEQCQHEPVDVNDECVHRLAVFRGQLGHAENMIGKPLGHTLGGFCCGGLLSASICAFSPRTTWTKNSVMHVSTVRMTPIRVKIPQFMPLASGESDLP